MALVDDIHGMMADPANGLPIDTPREMIPELLAGRTPARESLG
jgi:hypothetical protein